MMTEERAREILAHMIQPDGSLYDEECLPIWRLGDTGALLMGRYTWDECIAIGLWIKTRGETKHGND